MLIRFGGSLFLPVLIIEFIVAYFFVLSYGFGYLVIEILLSAAVGIALLFSAGFGGIGGFSLTPAKIFSSIGFGLAGFLLFMPGILSDIFGVIIAIVSFVFKNKNSSDLKSENFRYKDDEIIDVQVVDEHISVR
ncbi:hypothetical protein [Campylobacter majalis]|uniref:hypothetical protein n=1 Tax=Campylobacter majalis TaxID=2790656 RepID=UPI003D684C3B